LVVYHGTLSDFMQFKLSKEGSLGSGIYFTPQTAFANSYAGMPTPSELSEMEASGTVPKSLLDQMKAAAAGNVAPGQVGGNVIPAYVHISNPLIIRTTDRRFDPAVDLLVAFFMAVDGHDQDMMQRVVEKIRRFNSANPGVAIVPDGLIKSVKQRYKDRALANVTGGMGINKKLIPELQGMLDYSRD